MPVFYRIVIALVATLPVVLVPQAAGDPLSIYEIQYTTDPDGNSDYDFQIIDCAGGVVVGKFAGWKPRIILQDPEHPDGWGAIQVKDWSTETTPLQDRLFVNVHLGDEIELYNVEVEEFRGNTMLQWYPDADPQPTFARLSTGNPIPPPTIVPVSAMPAPIEDPPGEWYVEDHDAEPYESMHLIVRNVTVTEWNLGKANDNYNLQTPALEDCWAADYMNEDRNNMTGYHPFVTPERHFCAVTGLFEQYTNRSSGWDYYQLVTRTSADLAICGDGDADGNVNLADLPRFHDCFAGPMCDDGGCDQPSWTPPAGDLHVQHCLMMDLDYDGDVDLRDFAGVQVILEAQ